MKARPVFRLQLLGRFLLFLPGASHPTRLSVRKSAALLAYLAMAPNHSATREELATFLWGGCSDQQARQSLRQALLVLRKDIGRPDLVTSGAEIVSLQAEDWSVDALAFESLSRSPDPADLAAAARLLSGDFLEGLNLAEEGFDEWISQQRHRLQRAVARLCERFAADPALVRDGEVALAAAERLHAFDPLREEWQRLVIALCARYRGNAEALEQAAAFATLLKRELDVAPTRETLRLVERIRNDETARLGNALAPESTLIGKSDLRGVIAQSESSAGPVQTQRQRRSIPAFAAIAAASLIAFAGAVFVALKFGTPLLPRSVVEHATSPTIEFWRSPSPERDASNASGIIPLAVLPFTAIGDESKSTQLLADMMTDDLINVLSRIPTFRVISRQTTNRYKSQPIDILAIGGDLRVGYILEGSARVQDGVIRVNLQLYDPKTALPVWAGRVEREEANRYAVRDEIVARIARELQIDISSIEGERRADNSADASAFLGWAAMQAAFTTINIEEYRRAEALFKQALQRDPQHASALIGLGSYHTNLGVQRLDGDTQTHFDRAYKILSQVVERNPKNSTALYQFGILLQGTRRIPEALKLFEKSVELNPSGAGAHAHIGHALARIGEPSKGIDYVRYAMRLSPKDPAQAIWHEFLGNAQLELSLYKEAAESFLHAATLAPRYPRTWAGLAAAYALAGDIENADAALEKLKQLNRDPSADSLVKSFGRDPNSRLHAGLTLALSSLGPLHSPDAGHSQRTDRTTPSPESTRGQPKTAGKVSVSWQSPLPAFGADENRAQPTDIRSLAVLPFTTYGETDESVRPMAEAITGDLTDILSRIPALRVISSQTMRTYAGQNFDVANLAAELGVRYVLHGNIRRHADKLRVNVELIDPSTRTTIWTLRVERNANDQYGVQDEIVGRLGRELHYEYYRVESERVSADSGIRQLLFKGWNAVINHADLGLEKLQQARSAFDEVLAHEPDNDSARLGLGWYHVLVGSLMLDADRDSHLDDGEKLLIESLRRLPNSSGAHFMMGLLNRMRGRLPEGLASYMRAVEINPSFASAYAHIGHTLVQMGRAKEGSAQINYALRLSPRDAARSHWNRFAGEARIELNDVEGGIALLQESYRLNRRQPLTLRALASAYALSGQLEDARTILAELKTVAPHISPGKSIAPNSKLGVMQPELMRGLQIALSSNI